MSNVEPEDPVFFQVVLAHQPANDHPLGQVPQVEHRRLDDMLIVEKGLRVLYRAILRLVDVVLLPHVVIPIDTLRQEPV